MPITFKCSNCQAQLQAVNDLAGKQGLCPKCKKEITVPEQDSKTKDEAKEAASKD